MIGGRSGGTPVGGVTANYPSHIPINLIEIRDYIGQSVLTEEELN